MWLVARSATRAAGRHPLRQQPAVAGQRVLEGGGDRMLRRQPVVQGEDPGVKLAGERDGDGPVRHRRACHVAAAVQVVHHRGAGRRAAAGNHPLRAHRCGHRGDAHPGRHQPGEPRRHAEGMARPPRQGPRVARRLHLEQPADGGVHQAGAAAPGGAVVAAGRVRHWRGPGDVAGVARVAACDGPARKSMAACARARRRSSPWRSFLPTCRAPHGGLS